MLHETIKRIETEVESNITNETQKQELLELIAYLKVEIESLKDNHHDDARSIAGFTETGVVEATREYRDEVLLNHALTGMKLSVKRFEVSHPNLIGLINAIGRTLSSIGI